MRSLCRACGETFSTVRSFERHRLGTFTLEPPHYGRRCLTVAELEADPAWRRTRYGRWTRERAWEGLSREALAP